MVYEAILDLWKAPTCLNIGKSYQGTSLHSFCLHWMPHFSFGRSRKAQNIWLLIVTLKVCLNERIQGSRQCASEAAEQKYCSQQSKWEQKLDSCCTYSDVGPTQLTTITFCNTEEIIYITIQFKITEIVF